MTCLGRYAIIFMGDVMLNGKIYGRYSLVYLHVWQYHEESDEPVTYKPKNRKRLVNGIVYMREGNATVHELDNNRIFTVHPGELMLIPMDVAYTITWEAGTRRHDLADFLFNYDCCIQYHSERGVTTCDTINMSRRDVLPSFLPSGKITVIPADSHSDSLETIWKELHEAYNSTDDYIAFTINSRFYRLLDYLHSALYPSRNITAGDEIDRARMYIETHCTESLTITALAKRFSLDRSYFSRRFKEAVGMPPIEYKNRIRMRLAEGIVAGTSRRISEIAEILGFSSEAHFRKCFCDEFGMPPLQFRKENRAQFAANSDINRLFSPD